MPNDRLYVYVSSGNGIAKSLTRHSQKNSLTQWLRYRAPNTFVAEIANTWSGTEASAYALHILTHYYEMAPKIVFLHAHDGSWHSKSICRLLDDARRAPDDVSYRYLNYRYEKRCLSPRGVVGSFLDDKVRDFYYNNWRLWTNSTPPVRVRPFTRMGFSLHHWLEISSQRPHERKFIQDRENLGCVWYTECIGTNVKLWIDDHPVSWQLNGEGSVLDTLNVNIGEGFAGWVIKDGNLKVTNTTLNPIVTFS